MTSIEKIPKVSASGRNFLDQGDQKRRGKVNGHYTTKKRILGAIKSFIVTTRMGHLVISIKIPKTLIFGVNLRPIEFEINFSQIF